MRRACLDASSKAQVLAPLSPPLPTPKSLLQKTRPGAIPDMTPYGSRASCTGTQGLPAALVEYLHSVAPTTPSTLLVFYTHWQHPYGLLSGTHI